MTVGSWSGLTTTSYSSRAVLSKPSVSVALMRKRKDSVAVKRPTGDLASARSKRGGGGVGLACLWRPSPCRGWKDLELDVLLGVEGLVELELEGDLGADDHEGGGLGEVDRGRGHLGVGGRGDDGLDALDGEAWDDLDDLRRGLVVAGGHPDLEGLAPARASMEAV